MKYYADATITLNPSGWYEDLCVRLQWGSRSRVRQGCVADEVARDALIYCGLLEQAAEDEISSQALERRGSLPLARIARATDIAAEVLAGNPVWPNAVAALSAALEQIARIYHGRTAVCVLPEGFAFYGVFPELYIALGRTIAAQMAEAPFVVIGVRSIGSALSAAVQAGLRQAGRSVRRFTVRPTGDPFARVTAFTKEQAARCRSAISRDALFVVVDEGPGLSGSSIASVIQALEELGLSSERMAVACANRPDHLPMAPESTVSIWQRVRWWAAQDLEQMFWQVQVPTLLARHLGTSVTLLGDLSWGQWSSRSGQAQPVLLPQMERRKLLVEIEGHQVLAKFIGFGEVGARKARIAAKLSEHGLVPRFRDYAHGLLLSDWVAGRTPRQTSPRERQALISMAAPYYAHIFRYARSPEHLSTRAQAATVRAIGAAWLATSVFPVLEAYAARADAGGVQAVDGDQRPEAHEWLLAGDTILKCDAADHFLDHTWARSMDICFDLAGFAHEWRLSAAEVGFLLDLYGQISGDSTVQHRLPFFAAVYTAHRLSTFDQAFHAARPPERQAIEGRRQMYGAALQQILTGIGGYPCVS